MGPEDGLELDVHLIGAPPGTSGGVAPETEGDLRELAAAHTTSGVPSVIAAA
jgi:hypothetical protein